MGARSTAALADDLRQPLIRYLICLGLSADDARDVAQESFLRLHRHVTAERPAGNLRSWLFRVAHNEARNWQQKYERRFAAPIEEARNVSVPPAVEDEMLRREKLKRVSAAIRGLRPLERECLLLRAEGKRYREIAGALGLSISTVADAVDRAIRKIAEECND